MAVSRILVPVEYSEHCRAALEYAGSLAAELGASIDVIHVWERPHGVPEDVTVSRPGVAPRSLFELMAENAENEMKEFLGKARMPSGVAVAHHLESGEPSTAILAAIERRRPDMVVMSTHGRTGIRHLLMGSVAERVVRSSPVPVVAVPARAGASG